jgi:hypothetical protein
MPDTLVYIGTHLLDVSACLRLIIFGRPCSRLVDVADGASARVPTFTQVVTHCDAYVAVVSAGDAWIGGGFASVAFVPNLAAALVRASYIDTFGIVLTSVPAALVDTDATRATASRNHPSVLGSTLLNVVRMHRIVVARPVGKAAGAGTFEFADRYRAISGRLTARCVVETRVGAAFVGILGAVHTLISHWAVATIHVRRDWDECVRAVGIRRRSRIGADATVHAWSCRTLVHVHVACARSRVNISWFNATKYFP